MNVASVTTTATTQGLIAGRSAATYGTGMEAVAALIRVPTPPSMHQETGRSHLSLWYDAASDHSVAEHLGAGVEKCGKVNKRDRKSFVKRPPPSIGTATQELRAIRPDEGHRLEKGGKLPAIRKKPTACGPSFPLRPETDKEHAV